MSAEGWEPAEQVAKNADGAYRAFMGGEWVPVAQAAKNASGQYMVFRGAPAAKQAPVKTFTPSGEKPEIGIAEAVASDPTVRFAMGAAEPVIGAAQLAAHATGVGKDAIDSGIKQVDEMKRRGMEARNAPAAGAPMVPSGEKSNIGTALESVDVAGGIGNLLSPVFLKAAKMLPAAKTTGQAVKQGAGMGAGAGATMPVLDTENFGREKTQQIGAGAIGGGLFSGMLDKLLRRTAPTAPTPAPRPVGEGAEKVVNTLQDVRGKIEGKVADKVSRADQEGTRLVGDAERTSADALAAAERNSAQAMSAAEQRLAAARGAPSADPRMTGSEFGSVTREAMNARKLDLEAARESGAMPFLEEALNSGAKVNISGIPKQIDLMLKNEKNPDVVRALLKAKATLLAKDEGANAADAIMARLAAAKPGSPEYRALYSELQAAGAQKGPPLDTSMRGLDSARLAINSMLSGQGSEPADRFAQKQLMQIVNMLEKGMSDASPAYGQYLTKYRELSRPLDTFAPTGQTARTGATLQKGRFEGDFTTSPESIGPRFLKAGPEGAAAAREFKNAGGDPQAMAAYVRNQLKNATPDEWGAYLNRHEPALREIGVFDALKAQESAALTAAGGVKTAKDAGAAAIKTAKEQGAAALQGARAQAKGLTQSAAQTEKNVSQVIKQGVLGETTFGGTGRAPTGLGAQNVVERAFQSDTPDRAFRQLVSMTRNDPEARAGLRRAFEDFLTTPDPGGKVDIAAAAKNWQRTRDAVQKSELLTPDHFAAVDKVMADLYRRESGASGLKTVVSGAAALVGATPSIGRPGTFAQGARTVMGFLTQTEKSPEQVRQMVAQAIDDERLARFLASDPTQANIDKAVKMLGVGAGMGSADAVTRPPRKENLTRPNPFGMRPGGL